MPKIVPDMQNKILTTAERQFKENGFDKTDMREVAAEAEVAVGTIYLHYQNKETLYMHVISHSWENTLQRIEEISTSDNEPAKRLKFILHELVQDMVKRKSQSSLWMEIGSMHHHQMGNLPMNGHVSGVRDPISRIISTLLKEIAKKKTCSPRRSNFRSTRKLYLHYDSGYMYARPGESRRFHRPYFRLGKFIFKLIKIIIFKSGDPDTTVQKRNVAFVILMLLKI